MTDDTDDLFLLLRDEMLGCVNNHWEGMSLDPVKTAELAVKIGNLLVSGRSDPTPTEAQLAAAKVQRIARIMRKILPDLPFCEPDVEDLERAAAVLWRTKP